MERVKTLIRKFEQQIDENASPDKLLMTLHLIQAEILLRDQQLPRNDDGKVVVIMPGKTIKFNDNTPVPKQEPEKTIEVLKVDEKEIEEELEEIKRNAEAKSILSANAKPSFLFDPIEDVPTLSHQTPVKRKEINDSVHTTRSESVNEKLKQSKIELSEMLTEVPVRDLRKAIGVNDRFLFINELFRGDEAMYERSIKTINNFSIFPEAQYWIQRELKTKIGWNEADAVVQQFDQLVKRRFS